MLEVQQCFPSETFGNGGFSLWDPPSKAVQLDRFSSGDLSTDCGPPRITNPIACAVAGDLDGLEVVLRELGDCEHFPARFLHTTALDAAVRAGQLPAARSLQVHVPELSNGFLLAAVESSCSSGGSDLLAWALQTWFGRFNCRQPFGPQRLRELQDALRLACSLGHTPQVQLLLAYMVELRSADAYLRALCAASAAGHAALVTMLLAAQPLQQQLAQCGPRFKQQAAASVADCLCDSAAAGHLPVLQALLAALLPPSGTLAGVAPALGPHMQRVYTTVAAAGQTAALNQLLVQLPDHADAFDHIVLEAALAAGHTATADVVCWLLALRYSPSELTALQQRSAGLASARLAGQLKAAAAAGDKEALAATLGSYVAQEEELLAAVRAAAAAGSMESAAVLVAPCTKQAVAPGAIMRALCMGACSSGQGLLLQSVALESPELQQHLRQDVGAVVDYLGAAALGGHATVAAWLLGQSLQPWAVLEAALRVLLTQHRLKFLSPAAASNSSDTTRPSSSAPLTPGLLLQLVVAAERTQPSCTLPLPPDVVSLLLVVGGDDSALSQHVCQLLGARSRSSTPSIASGSSLSREGSSCLPDVVALVRI